MEQISIFDYMAENTVKPCECGAIPELVESKCCRWNENSPQKYLSVYICPKCLNAPHDNTGWTVEAWGTRDQAAKEAIKNWNTYPKKSYGIVPFDFTEVGRRLKEYDRQRNDSY